MKLPAYATLNKRLLSRELRVDRGPSDSDLALLGATKRGRSVEATERGEDAETTERKERQNDRTQSASKRSNVERAEAAGTTNRPSVRTPTYVPIQCILTF